MALESKESPSNNPGLEINPDDDTKGYYMQQTMFRIKDPKASLDFYSHVLGMTLLKRLDVPQYKFSVYLMGYGNPALAPNDPVERLVWTLRQKAIVELRHTWGTENDPDFKGYHNGNSEPFGFGHIGIAVDDSHKACERFERLGVEFVGKPDEGKSNGVSFIKDPDGYWVEIIDVRRVAETTTGNKLKTYSQTEEIFKGICFELRRMLFSRVDLKTTWISSSVLVKKWIVVLIRLFITFIWSL